MSLRDLASRVGVSAPFLSDVEHNRRSTDKLSELASALDVSPDDLKRFDKRLSTDLKEWMGANPELSALLEEYRRSGRPVEQLLRALRTSSRKPASRRS
jgi:transcriptional regulator with XRE-family HTH domain